MRKLCWVNLLYFNYFCRQIYVYPLKKHLSTALKVVISVALACAILWWMYRGVSGEELRSVLLSDVRWGWMLASLPFGFLAQWLRALRWRQALEPLGYRPSRADCLHAVLISYGSSLVVPRIGEVLRCAVLGRRSGVGFSRSVGTVVTERLVDSAVMLALTSLIVLGSLPTFLTFAKVSGYSASKISISRALDILIFVSLLVSIILVLWRWIKKKAGSSLRGLLDGLLSVRLVRNKTTFVARSFGIWLAYFLHFYVAFFCFDATASLGIPCALVAFIAGAFAVLVPTPNGAGPWHFAVKTVLVLYGVGQKEAAMFVLVVHTVQTLFVLLLGLVSGAIVYLRR